MKKLNADQISFIKVKKKQESRFIWKEEKKFWGILIRQAGFYYFGEQYIEQRLIDDGFLIEDQKVYYRPVIIFYMSNGSAQEKEFKSDDEMFFYLNSDPLMQTLSWIEV